MFNYIFRTQARSISRILKVSPSHPKVEVMLWSFLMLSTVATNAAVGCQVRFIPSRFDCILPDSTSTGNLPQRALYALSPMSIHPKDKWVGIAPPDPDKADFRLDPDIREIPEFELRCTRGNISKRMQWGYANKIKTWCW